MAMVPTANRADGLTSLHHLRGRDVRLNAATKKKTKCCLEAEAKNIDKAMKVLEKRKKQCEQSLEMRRKRREQRQQWHQQQQQQEEQQQQHRRDAEAAIVQENSPRQNENPVASA